MDIKELIKKSKEKYNKIKYISCPAFKSEFIYFNREGFNHLLRKGDSLRSIEDQRERLLLIPNAIVILKTSKKYSDIRTSIKDSSIAYFWSFDGRKGDKEITVVLRQINDGNKHFFSVFYKR